MNFRLLIPIEFLILPIFNSREQERKAQKVIMLQNITSYHLFLFCKNRNKMWVWKKETEKMNDKEGGLKNN